MSVLCQLSQFLRCAFVAWVFTGDCGAATESEASDGRAVLNVSFDRSIFRGLNEHDAVAALKIWTSHFIESQGAEVQVRISSYESRRELDALLASGQSDLMIMNALKYLKTERTLRDTISPQFVTTVNEDSPYERYHLIVHTDSGIRTFEDLRGKKVLLLKANRSQLTEDWFQYEVEKVGLAAEEVQLQVVGDVSKALLPVFFKQSDACIVNDAAYELMKEFNPQLGRRLQPVMTSQEFTEIVICLRDGYQNERGKVLKGLSELHSDATGRQMVLIFKISRLIPYQPDYLDAVSELFQSQPDNE